MNSIQQTSQVNQAALWTARGRGAVATIRFMGDPSIIDSSQTINSGVIPFFQAVNGRLLNDQSVGDVVFGFWGIETPEEVVLCRLSEYVLAIHCHGGEIAVSRIMNDLKSINVKIVNWNQLNEKNISSFDIEMNELLSQTQTVRTANIALQQQSGLLFSAFQNLSVPNPDQQWGDLANLVNQLLKWSPFGLHLTTAWKVVIAGRPNVGKSSLVNQLAGFERAIVFDEPGTTRDAVGIELVFDGWLMQVVDTAGIRSEAISLEKEGITRSLSLLEEADCQVIVLDQSQPLTGEDINLLDQCPNAIIVSNKCDLPNAWDKTESSLDHPSILQVIPLSALSGEGIESLCEKIIETLIPDIPEKMLPIPVTLRQIECLQQALTAINDKNNKSYQLAIKRLLF